MSEETNHTHRHHHVLTLCLALIALVAACLLPFLMRDRVRAEIRETARSITSEQEKLTAKVDGLKVSLDSLSNKAAPDTESIAELKRVVAETSTMIEVLGTRLDEAEKKATEKKPEPVAVAPTVPAPSALIEVSPTPSTAVRDALKLAVLRGDVYATELAVWEKANPSRAASLDALRVFAASGIPTEAGLIRDLRAALPAISTATTAEDVSLVGKINTHMAGLVSIKKKAVDNDAYAPLRRELERADLPTLIRSVEQLDSTSRAPLAAWLKTATARADALSALATLDAKGGH
jgi:hypothetical protein